MSTGNTIGKVTGQPPGATVPASAANQPVEKPSMLESAKTSTQQAIDNWVERNEYSTSAKVAGALSTGLVEVVMPTALWEIIPVGKAFKLLKKGAELAGLTKKGEKTVEAVKDVKKVEPAKGKDGGKIKPRPKKKVKCFKPKDKHDAKDFDDQLKNQQDGLNSMSVDEYLKGRGAFSGMKCNDGNVEKDSKWSKADRPKRDQKLVNETRAKHQDKLEKQFKKDGHTDPTGAAANVMKGLAALHNPDMIAGGLDTFDKNSAISMGDKSINSSIGSQWKSRIGELDAEACKAKKEGKGNEKMNAELSRCPKTKGGK